LGDKTAHDERFLNDNSFVSFTTALRLSGCVHGNASLPLVTTDRLPKERIAVRTYPTHCLFTGEFSHLEGLLKTEHKCSVFVIVFIEGKVKGIVRYIPKIGSARLPALPLLSPRIAAEFRLARLAATGYTTQQGFSSR
jgi:hypothetical protein